MQCSHGKVPFLIGWSRDWVPVRLRVPMSALIRVSLRLGGLLVQIMGGFWDSGILVLRCSIS